MKAHIASVFLHIIKIIIFIAFSVILFIINSILHRNLNFEIAIIIQGVYKMKKITQSTLAAELQLSRNTIARVLNNQPGVTESTRRAVLMKAEELGYVRPSAQKNTSESTTGEVVLLSCATFLRIPFWIDIIEGLESYFTSQKITLRLALVTLEQMNTEVIPDSLSLSKSDGIAFIGNFNTCYYNLIHTLDIPSISYDMPYDEPLTDSHSFIDIVSLSNSESIACVTERIISKGHKNIAFVGKRTNPASFAERYHGFKKAIENHGLTDIEIPALLQINNNSPSINTADLYKELNEISDPPTAYVCVNDETALCLLKFKKKHPDLMKDAIITGFDNSSLFSNQSELDATVEAHPYHIGRMMAVQLHTHIKERSLPNFTLRINATPIFNTRLK